MDQGAGNCDPGNGFGLTIGTNWASRLLEPLAVAWRQKMGLNVVHRSGESIHPGRSWPRTHASSSSGNWSRFNGATSATCTSLRAFAAEINPPPRRATVATTGIGLSKSCGTTSTNSLQRSSIFPISSITYRSTLPWERPNSDSIRRRKFLRSTP